MKVKTQRTSEQNDRRIVIKIVVLNNPVVLVCVVLLASRGFVCSASPLVLAGEEQSLWRAKKMRIRRKRRSTVEKRRRCGHGDSKTNLSHWIGVGREDDGSIIADEEHERLETHEEEENHRIFSRQMKFFPRKFAQIYERFGLLFTLIM